MLLGQNQLGQNCECKISQAAFLETKKDGNYKTNYMTIVIILFYEMHWNI